jgi:SAC3/GANP family
LNQFYDDSLRRSVIEVPDEHGNETRRDLSGFSHGCSSDDVQGVSPVEFDGTVLENSASGPLISQRILGKHAVNHPNHGTAEPEMRGIYMLLTMNNEGGMEVLKYAAKLFQERPEIYHSRPIQLALDFIKVRTAGLFTPFYNLRIGTHCHCLSNARQAKKEYNYARFFSILRAPTTPYLFCCVMFKHVELMRKAAFRIMSKVFGGRRKDTGEGVDDAYPLSRLVDLLCFENASEARAACQHYNITVKECKSSTSDKVTEIIFWKNSDFKEPRHPEKEYVLPLPPLKMTRTIERKLNGATRLAVCRGQASGEGAILQSKPSGAVSTLPISNLVPSFERDAEAAALLRQQQIEAAELAEQRKVQEQEKRKLAIERKKEEQERLRREEKERKAEEEKQRLLHALEVKKKEEEIRRQNEEAQRLAAEMKTQEEARLRDEEAAARRAAEEAYRKAEEERRLAEEAQRREDEARRERERQQRIREEQRRIEEAKRQERLRLECEAERRRKAEERRQAKEWEDKVDAAKKILIWRRWKNRVSRSIETTYGASLSLRQVDPTFGSSKLGLQSLYEKTRQLSKLGARSTDCGRSFDIRRTIEACNRNTSSRLSLSQMSLEEFVSSPGSNASDGALLLKVALLIPHSVEDDSTKMAELLLSWLDARVGIDKVDSAYSAISGSRQTIRTRSVVHLCRTPDDCFDCDVALVVVPPPLITDNHQRNILSSYASILDDSMPLIALALGDFGPEGDKHVETLLSETLRAKNESLKVICNRGVSVDAVEKALETACRCVSSAFVKESCVEIERMTIPDVASRAVSTFLWGQIVTQGANDGNLILEYARSAIATLVSETEQVLKLNDEIWASWPPKDFVSRDGVQGYFADGSSLPAHWGLSLGRETFGKGLSVVLDRLMGSFRDVIESLLFDAPVEMREDCGVLIAKGYYRRCLQLALDGFANYADKSEWGFAYFPRGTFEMILNKLSNGTGKFPSNFIPSLVLPTPDTTLLDITAMTHDDNVQGESYAVPEPASPDRTFVPTPQTTGSKRRRSGDRRSHPSYDHLIRRSGDPKRARGSDTLKSSRDVDESAALTKTMQDLLDGGTADLLVGDEFLSRILRGVAMMDTN